MNKEINIRGSSADDFSSDSTKFYENYWKRGGKISKLTNDKNRFILEYFFKNGLKDSRVLEIGVGGEGGIILNLKDENEVYGIDISASAQRNCEKLGLPIIVHNLDTDELPFESDSFDVVFAFEVFEHFSAPQFVLEQIRRILKSEGILLLSTPNPLMHHWPRLFYPELFEEKSFGDFLKINMFQIARRICLGQNKYWQVLSDELSKAWSWIWQCEKINGNQSKILFDYGKYFWDQKNDSGIRIKPIEAIDLFKKSCEADNRMVEAKFYLARALTYRFIYGENQEFIEHLNYVITCAKDNQYPANMKALYHFALIYIELKRFGIEMITEAQFNEAVSLLSKFSESAALIKNIHQELEGTNRAATVSL
jgi:SAM-dependent methyltransferase